MASFRPLHTPGQVTADVAYDTMLFFWRIVTNLFFREVRPRGAFNIPRDGPVIFAVAPHHNQVRGLSHILLYSCFTLLQFLDPLLVMSEVYRETHRRVRNLIAAKSMERAAVGFFAALMSSSKQS